MATIDVRGEVEEVVTAIKFSDSYATHLIGEGIGEEGSFVMLYDDNNDYVVINDKEHALNLIKALNKAIELGWLV